MLCVLLMVLPRRVFAEVGRRELSEEEADCGVDKSLLEFVIRGASPFDDNGGFVRSAGTVSDSFAES